MKLHYVQYTVRNGDESQSAELASWHASGDAASKASTALKSKDSIDRKSIKRASVEVPTKKDELVEFLTTLTGDNLHTALDALGDKD